MTKDRDHPCATCPFAGRLLESIEAIEQSGRSSRDRGGSPMLCHESGCLDGDGPDDYWCRGHCEAMKECS